MVILTILSSLMLSGLLVARNRSREVKTTATIRKLSEIILPYYEEYETRRPHLDQAAVSQLMLDGSPRNRRILADYKRVALRRLMALELPDRASDIDEAGTLEQTAPYTPPGHEPLRLTELPTVTRRYQDLLPGANVESGELLHLIVTRGVVADPDIIAHFRDDEVADTDNDGLREFIDGWGNPIMFKRWPVGFQSPLQPITGSLSDIDPLVSTSGHRLLPLIFSAGRNESYDIVAGDVSYQANQYDPFARRPPVPADNPLRGEVFLKPTSTEIPSTNETVTVFSAVPIGPVAPHGCLPNDRLPQRHRLGHGKPAQRQAGIG